MKKPIIIDAGPALNFFSINKERLLFNVISPIQAPAIVIEEIRRKANKDQRFKSSLHVLNKLPKELLKELSDTANDELSAAARQLGISQLVHRQTNSKDLGETMVVLHAMVYAQKGHHVITIIDDSKGQKLAVQAATILDHLRPRKPEIGTLKIVDTIKILENAVKKGFFKDKNELRRIYEQMRKLDDGLIHIDQTELLRKNLWNHRGNVAITSVSQL